MRHAQSIPSVAFAMAISLTLFACSDSSSSGDDNEVSSSSSELNEESSSSSEDLSSSSEAESSSSEAESSSSEDLSSSSEAESSSSEAESSSSEDLSSSSEAESSSSEAESSSSEDLSSSSEAESSSSEAESSSSEDLSSSSEAESSSSEAESSSSEVSSSSSFEEDGTLGTLDDERDDKTYSTVVIGSQVWMAENLNFDTKSDGSVCYGNDKTNETNCTTYGRLYDWETATTACPGGWHLPSDAEWTTLATYVGGNSTAGTKLKATSGWDNNGNGTDDYGFSALPGGYGYSSGNFYNVDKYGTWWSATEATNASNAYYRRMQDSNGSMDRVNYGKVEGLFSVRCLKN